MLFIGGDNAIAAVFACLSARIYKYYNAEFHENWWQGKGCKN